MGLFDKKKDMGDIAIPQPPVIDLSVPPTEKIQTMRSQGLDNNQIIQNLQNEGYNSDAVLKGINQADITAGIEPNPPIPTTPTEQNFQNPMELPTSTGGPIPTQNMNSMPMGNGVGQIPPPQMQEQGMGGMPPIPPPDMDNLPPPIPGMGQIPPPQMQNQMGQPNPNEPMQAPQTNEEVMSIERIEEIAEAIIDEKWNEIVKSINKIIDWKDKTETKIVRIEQRFVDLRKDFDTLSQGILGKIGEYDHNLGNLGIEIKAMEKVFQKVLPGLSENVHALDRITKDLKDKK